MISPETTEVPLTHDVIHLKMVVYPNIVYEWNIPTTEVLNLYELCANIPDPFDLTIDGTNATSPLRIIKGLNQDILTSLTLISLRDCVELPKFRRFFPVFCRQLFHTYAQNLTLRIVSCNSGLDLLPLSDTTVRRLVIDNSVLNCLPICLNFDQHLETTNSTFNTVKYMSTPDINHRGLVDGCMRVINCKFPTFLGVPFQYDPWIIPLKYLCHLTLSIEVASMFTLIRNKTHHLVGTSLIPEFLQRDDTVANPYVMTEITDPVVTAMCLASNVSRRSLEFVIDELK